MNTVKEIQTALADLVVQMVEKGIVTPAAQLMIENDSGHWVHMRAEWNTKTFDGNDYLILNGETPAECIARAIAYIAAMPSPEDRVTHEYLSKVAAAVDYATEHSLPDEYVAPLRGVSTAMTENLLTHEVQS